MDKVRFQKENKAEQELVFYNFNKRINDVLINGTPVDVFQIISSYCMYTQTILSFMKYGENNE